MVAVTNGTELFTPDMFEQGGFALSVGQHWSTGKVASANTIRLKEPIRADEVLSIIGAIDGYQAATLFLDANGNFIDNSGWWQLNTGRHNLPQYPYILLVFTKVPEAAITPDDVSSMQVRYGKRYWTGKAGVQYIEGYVLANQSSTARNGMLVLKSKAGSTTFNLPMAQTGKAISVTPETLNFPAAGGTKSVILTAIGDWYISYSPPRSNVSKVSGAAGTYAIDITVEANGGIPRTDTVDFELRNSGDVVSVTLNQE